MIKRLLFRPLAYAVFACAITPAFAHSQSAPFTQITEAQQYSKSLYEKALSGREGALAVSYTLASCHGFQSAFYAHLTRDVELVLRDIQMSEAIARDSQRAGYAATFLIFEHKSDPDVHVNLISRSVRREWETKLDVMGDDLEATVWDTLLKCKRIAPLSNYLFEESLKENSIPSGAKN